MNPYYNLPPEQRVTQRMVDQYNADARRWNKLVPRRRARRRLLSRFLSRRMLKKLALLEFAKARPPAGLHWPMDSAMKIPKEPNRHEPALVKVVPLDERILTIRGHKVILDADLAHLYGVTTKRLNEQIKRNRRFT